MENASPAPDIESRSYAFALRIVRLCRALDKTAGTSRTLANQLLRSGTSIGANIEEAHSAASRADFVHKMTIALKEARETRYWLRLLTDSTVIKPTLLAPILQESTEIMKILGAIVSKCRKSK